MGLPELQTGYSLNDYLEIERHSEVKHEYHDGEIYAMAGGSYQHNRLSTNATIALGVALKNKKCFAANSDQQVAVSKSKYVYPDVSVICGKFEAYSEHPHAAKNPVVIVEVLSPDTESYDRGGKFMRYRQIDTFREYVLISQTEILIEVFYKNELGFWEIETYTQPTDTIVLKSIDVNIPLADIYEGLDIPLMEV
jgi:Uma2 family endonuclease